MIAEKNYTWSGGVYIRGPIWIETDKNGFSVIVVYLTNRPIYPPIFIRLYIRIGYIRINWSILYEFVKYTTITEIRFYPFLSISDLYKIESIFLNLSENSSSYGQFYLENSQKNNTGQAKN